MGGTTQLDKVSIKKPTDNMIFNERSLKIFTKVKKKTKIFFLSRLLFNIILYVLASAVRQENKIKKVSRLRRIT